MTSTSIQSFFLTFSGRTNNREDTPLQDGETHGVKRDLKDTWELLWVTDKLFLVRFTKDDKNKKIDLFNSVVVFSVGSR